METQIFHHANNISFKKNPLKETQKSFKILISLVPKSFKILISLVPKSFKILISLVPKSFKTKISLVPNASPIPRVGQHEKG
jgi:hypothetical protein